MKGYGAVGRSRAEMHHDKALYLGWVLLYLYAGGSHGLSTAKHPCLARGLRLIRSYCVVENLAGTSSNRWFGTSWLKYLFRILSSRLQRPIERSDDFP